MNVHVFGGTSSPSCSNYVFRRTVANNEVKYGPEVSETPRSNFYEKTAIKFMQGVRRICTDGGFHLTKFISNNKQVLASIPEDERRNGVLDQDLKFATLPTEKALGIYWNTEEDCLGFEVNIKERPNTKTGMLAVVSSIYDPLGLVSPFALEGKETVQQLCFDKLGWDELVNEKVRQQWQCWKSKLKSLKNMKSNRCYKPSGFGKVISCSLHYFSDASERGHGQATYIRLVNEAGKVHCSLVMGKSRVSKGDLKSLLPIGCSR